MKRLLLILFIGIMVHGCSPKQDNNPHVDQLNEMYLQGRSITDCYAAAKNELTQGDNHISKIVQGLLKRGDQSSKALAELLIEGIAYECVRDYYLARTVNLK